MIAVSQLIQIFLSNRSCTLKQTNILGLVGLLGLFLLEGTGGNDRIWASPSENLLPLQNRTSGQVAEPGDTKLRSNKLTGSIDAQTRGGGDAQKSITSLRATPYEQVAQIPFPKPVPTPLPEPQPLPPLPPSEELLPSPPLSPTVPEIEPGRDSAVTIVVKRFKVVGSTVFSAKQLAAVLEPFTNRPLTLAELLQARSAVTQLYLNAGYVTSGAYIPPQEPKEGTITIQVIEGRVEDIQVTGNRRLRSSYVRSRLELATKPPLNINQLVEKLRLLKLNPLIENISAELSAGVQPGTSILMVRVTEADTFRMDLSTDNYYQTPAVGSWERQVELKQANLLGFGDGLRIGYTNTNGSNQVEANYTIPLNPRDGTLNLNYQFTSSHVVEQPFDELDINSEAQYYDLTYRQPIIQTPTEEFALSLTGSYEQSRSLFLENLLGEAIPFPTLGADADGWIRVSALRFAQEWTKQERTQVFALRSQFNVGLDLLGATINAEPPDSRFFSWLGQAQWVRLLAPDTLLLLRAQVQLTPDQLVPLEQIGIGGWSSVRGYRYDYLLTDNGAVANAELRVPLYRDRQLDGLLRGIVFFDIGTGWNVKQDNPNPNTLIGIGLGLQWQQGDRFSARIDWGIPLIDTSFKGNSLQDNGVYFSIRYSAF